MAGPVRWGVRMTDTETQRCTAWTAAGRQCPHRHGLVGNLCVFHDPERRDELKAMRQRGQAAGMVSRKESRRVRLAQASETAGPRPPIGDSLETVTQWLRWLAESAARGEVKVTEVAALTAVARLLLASLKERDLEQELRQLQRSYAALKKQAERGR